LTTKDKLFAAIRKGHKSIRFTDACRIAELLGFERKGGKGSHCTYGRASEPLMLNFQNCGGYIKPYQAKQLDELVKKYGAHT
jgi:hypothetical protein